MLAAVSGARGNNSMREQQGSTSTRNVQIIHGSTTLGVAMAVILATGVGHRAVASEPFILVLYFVGTIVAAMTWLWEFRWNSLCERSASLRLATVWRPCS
jgi:hypothetical protein